MKVLVVFGTRPEAIKMAPLVKMLKGDSTFECRVCVTAQHREMLDQVLSFFEIVPDYDLDLMSPNQDLYDITIGVLQGVKAVFEEFTPNIVLVHGDTTTTVSTALAAFYERIPIGHVEAGLRTGDLLSPWPEEGNRQLTARLSEWHFAPTETNVRALESEGIHSHSIIQTGNTVIDALNWAVEKIAREPSSLQHVKFELRNSGVDFDLAEKRYVLITGHRRENFGGGIERICEALLVLSKNNPDVLFVYPVHLNPKIKGPVEQYLGRVSNIFLIPPLGYETFISLLKNCYFVLTDSGGIQEEAPSLGKPVLVMRNTTERPEAVAAGTVKLVGTEVNSVVREAQGLLDNRSYYDLMSVSHNPYGDGYACKKIVEFLKKI